MHVRTMHAPYLALHVRSFRLRSENRSSTPSSSGWQPLSQGHCERLDGYCPPDLAGQDLAKVITSSLLSYDTMVKSRSCWSKDKSLCEPSPFLSLQYLFFCAKHWLRASTSDRIAYFCIQRRMAPTWVLITGQEPFQSVEHALLIAFQVRPRRNRRSTRA